MRTRSGRVSHRPVRLEPLVIGLTHADKTYFVCVMDTSAMETEVKYQAAVEAINNEEFTYVGAVIGGGFQNTKDLQVMNYDEDMATK